MDIILHQMSALRQAIGDLQAVIEAKPRTEMARLEMLAPSPAHDTRDQELDLLAELWNRDPLDQEFGEAAVSEFHHLAPALAA